MVYRIEGAKRDVERERRWMSKASSKKRAKTGIIRERNEE
jgi:hypothetical protein